MEITECVLEAASELSAPVDLWLVRDHFNYDLANQEWCFQGACSKGPKSLAEARDWVERICGWLQYKYPEGPPDDME